MNRLKNKNLKLLICGEGSQENELRELTKKYMLNNAVYFMGFRRDVPELLCAGDIFVFSSLWEGLGLAGIEAMYSYLPVIGSERQGIKDYVIENETGLLFEPQNIKELSQKIDTLVQDSVLRRSMEKKYSIDNCIIHLHEIYSKENIIKEE